MMASFFQYFSRLLQRPTPRLSNFDPNEETDNWPIFVNYNNLLRRSTSPNPVQHPQVYKVINTYLKNAPSSETYIPTSLSNVNASMMLFGEAPPDNFSSECWLEEHLHQFGNLNGQNNQRNHHLNGLSIDGNDSVNSEFDFFDDTLSESETLSDIIVTRTDDVVSLQGSIDSIESTTSEILDMLDRAITDGSNDCPPPYTEVEFDTPTVPVEPPPSYSDIFGSNSLNRPRQTSPRARHHFGMEYFFSNSDFLY